MAAVAVTLAAVALTAAAVSRAVPAPYMDEIFHVPQAQAYCAGTFDVWDGKITTPPGPYLVAWLATRVPGVPCSINVLRSINVVAGLLSVVLLKRVLERVRGGDAAAASWTEAVAVALFPVHVFFWFLFYTDTLATVLVLAAYLAALHNRVLLSALAATASLLFRQTNIAWVLFVLGTALLAHGDAQPGAHALKRRDSSASGSIALLMRACWERPGAVLGTAAPFVPAVAGFVAFVWLNKGIALGDRTNHELTLHVPQLLYFAAFAAVFSAPVLLSGERVRAFAAHVASVRGAVSSTVVLALGAVVVQQLTVEHRFLLSDNRHFSFYVWRHLFRRHPWQRFAYLPAYYAGGWHLSTALVRAQPLLWCLGYAAAVALVLVPSPLLEFRYFILPYLLLRLHCCARPPPPWRIWLELAVNVAVNAAALYIFLGRPFTQGGEMQRFMW